MRPGSPACYLCTKSKDRGMHSWVRTDDGARCSFCDLELTGEDAADVFRGARTPIGELQQPPGSSGEADWDEDDDYEAWT